MIWGVKVWFKDLRRDILNPYLFLLKDLHSAEKLPLFFCMCLCITCFRFALHFILVLVLISILWNQKGAESCIIEFLFIQLILSLLLFFQLAVLNNFSGIVERFKRRFLLSEFKIHNLLNSFAESGFCHFNARTL